MTVRESSKVKESAIDLLLEAGAQNAKKEDRFGDTRSGWWLDDVFLGKDPQHALQILKGGS